jgi:peptide/nickel transport system permease protein
VLGYVTRRLLVLLPTLIGVAFVVFILVRLMPGDPVTAMLGVEPSTPEQAAQLRDQLGLDEPIYVQFLYYLGRILQLDFGQSIASGQDVAAQILTALPMTIELAVASLLLAMLIAFPLGVASAVWRGSFIDAIARGLSVVSVSAPTYWVGLVLIYVVAVQLGWFPPSGSSGYTIIESIRLGLQTGDIGPLYLTLQHLALPALTLAIGEAGVLIRLVRSSMIDTLNADYIATARSKGLRELVVVIRHGLRNGLIPVVTVLGLQLGALLGGAVVTETIFAWPGIGRLVVNAVYSRDYPIIEAAVLMFGLIRILANFAVDLSYGVLDPRVRYS